MTETPRVTFRPDGCCRVDIDVVDDDGNLRCTRPALGWSTPDQVDGFAHQLLNVLWDRVSA